MDDMAIFDELPPAVRDVLRRAPLAVPAQFAREVCDKHGEDAAPAVIVAAVGRMLRR